MMERPLCPICDTKHFAREPHVFKTEVKSLNEVLRVKPKVDAPKEPEATQATVTVRPVVMEASIIIPPAVAKGKFDRAAYQREYMREYMRKRRAKD